jgi:hypothetical protein
MSGVKVIGELDVSERTVLAILDREASASVREATRMRATAINAAAPVGPTGRLSKSHKASVRKTPFGHVGRVRRNQDAWYGRIVERGRGDAEGTGPAAANPFVDRVDAAIESEAERILESGAEDAARQIEARF